jgi:mono/diheme cytochrome c family protein
MRSGDMCFSLSHLPVPLVAAVDSLSEFTHIDAIGEPDGPHPMQLAVWGLAMIELSRRARHMSVTRVLASMMALVATTPLLAQDRAPDQPDRMVAVEGQAYFRTYCTGCHGKAAVGDGPLAKDLKVAPADLTKLSERNDGKFPFEMVIQTIDHGRSVRGHGTEDMPAWGDAFKMTSQTKEQPEQMMKAIAHYLWTIQSK